jgi:hypothetical protein
MWKKQNGPLKAILREAMGLGFKSTRFIDAIRSRGVRKVRYSDLTFPRYQRYLALRTNNAAIRPTRRVVDADKVSLRAEPENELSFARSPTDGISK